MRSSARTASSASAIRIAKSAGLNGQPWSTPRSAWIAAATVSSPYHQWIVTSARMQRAMGERSGQRAEIARRIADRIALL